jgi:hypothetical protein
MKIAGAIVLVLALLLTGLWFAYVQAPDPEAVCAHKLAITLAEAGEQRGPAVDNLLDQLRLKCVKDKRTLLQLLAGPWSETLATVVISSTLESREKGGYLERYSNGNRNVRYLRADIDRALNAWAAAK